MRCICGTSNASITFPARSFTALDALKGWLADKSAAVHVGESEEWLRSRQADVQAHAAQTLDYDWWVWVCGAVRYGMHMVGGSDTILYIKVAVWR